MLHIDIQDCFREYYTPYRATKDAPANLPEGFRNNSRMVMATDALLVSLNECPEVKHTGQMVTRVNALWERARVQERFATTTREVLGGEQVTWWSSEALTEGRIRQRLYALRKKGLDLRTLPTAMQHNEADEKDDNMKELKAIAALSRLG